MSERFWHFGSTPDTALSLSIWMMQEWLCSLGENQPKSALISNTELPFLWQWVGTRGQLNLFGLCSGTTALYDLEEVSWHITLQENYGTSVLESSLECFRQTFGAAESLLTWLGKPEVLLENMNPKRMMGAREGGREGGREAECDSERGILTCSNPILPSASHSKHSAGPCQPSALPQGLVPKGSTCSEPTGAWAASPALPHPSISGQGSSAPSQKFCPIPSKGAPNTLHFAASARNGFQLSILKYLWLTVQEQWHAGNMICFPAP